MSKNEILALQIAIGELSRRKCPTGGEWPAVTFIKKMIAKFEAGHEILDPASIRAAALREAVEVVTSLLRFVENTEAELGIVLGSADKARAFLALIDKEPTK